MDEQKEKAEEQATKGTGAGNNGEEAISIEQADKIVKRMAEENDRWEENLKRQENLMARRMLGGQTSGPAQEDTKQKISDKDYAEKALKGELG